MHLGVADDAFRGLCASRFELRLDEHQRLPARPASASTGGRAFVTLMNDTSQTTRSGANGSSVRSRAFVRSSTWTRGSERNRGWSCP